MNKKLTTVVTFCRDERPIEMVDRNEEKFSLLYILAFDVKVNYFSNASLGRHKVFPYSTLLYWLTLS